MKTMATRARALLRGGAAVAAAGLLIGYCGAAAAHHSFSLFNMKTKETITGKVVEFQWTNPHTWTWVDVKNKDGSTTRWGLEGMSPNFLERRGWTKDTLKPGSVVKIVINPLKSGKPGGEFIRATLPDGTVKVMFPEK